MTDISGIDHFISFPFKMANLCLKELRTIDTKQLNKNNRNSVFIDAGLNIIGKKILKSWFRDNSNKQPKKQKYRFLPMLLGTLAASISENALSGQGVIRACERIIRAGQKF